ncbi:MAG TPA: cytochrome c biogenesis protein CcsA [Planctomycetaceae bacterium]|nr:cytochrome c biogenesis protein CcsA [Planctomycetaceae bacterium]HRA86740.1 cytochrome c biogenesis protein CcsA [Planctomycetaceae bacterium]
MAFLAQIQIYCFLMSYAVSLVCEAWLLVRRQSALARGVILAFTVAGFFAHTVYLITRSQAAGLPPLLSSQQDWLLVLAWIGALLYLALLVVNPQFAHGLFMLPAILLLIIVAVFVSRHSTGHLDQLALRRLGMFHAASLVLGIAAVVGAAITGLMYLLHHQRLRNRSGWLQRLPLPSLEVLTGVNRWMVVFSVPCLTIGLVTGFILIFVSRARDSANFISWTDPTIVTTVLVWVAMIIVLIRVLLSPHQTGKAVAQLSILSGGFLLTTVLGPMILSGSGNLSTFHSGSSEQSSLDRGDTLAVPDIGQQEASQ